MYNVVLISTSVLCVCMYVWVGLMPLEIILEQQSLCILWCGARLHPGPAHSSLSGLDLFCLRWSLKCTLLRGRLLVRAPQMHFLGD